MRITWSFGLLCVGYLTAIVSRGGDRYVLGDFMAWIFGLVAMIAFFFQIFLAERLEHKIDELIDAIRAGQVTPR